MEKISGILKTIFDEKLKSEIEGIMLKHKPVDNPKLVLIGGQPGSGKTSLERYINSKNKYVSINGDEYRKYHPQFEEFNRLYGQDASKYTQQWAGEFTAELVEFFKSNKYNVIIEGTFRTSELPIREALKFKNAGYEVEVDIMCVNKYLSYISTIKRYEDLINKKGSPRMTPKEHHDLVVSKFAENVDTIFNCGVVDRIRVFNRELEELYDSDNCVYTPRFLIENIVNPKTMSEEEIEKLNSEVRYIKNLMNNRNADIEQFNKIEEFEKEISSIEIEKAANIYDEEFEIDGFDYSYDRE
ncbi:MAG: zeta toxin family protein [Erysipelotrichaceae bacterium]|nr:zeta toxin family protein [Erysipelotrichaceae bacterium]